MDNLQRKSIKHAADVLDSFDQFQVYKDLSKAMEDEGIDPQTRERVLRRYQDTSAKEHKKIKEAKSWLEVIIDVK